MHDSNAVTFEDYLKEIHAKDYHGTDDDMPDSYDAWLTELDVDTLVKYGEDYSAIVGKRFSDKAVKNFQAKLNDVALADGFIGFSEEEWSGVRKFIKVNEEIINGDL